MGLGEEELASIPLKSNACSSLGEALSQTGTSFRAVPVLRLCVNKKTGQTPVVINGHIERYLRRKKSHVR